METIYIVQPFKRACRGLLPKLPRQLSATETATARVAGDYARVAAYSMDVDEDGGEYSQPRLLFQTGQVPDPS